VAGGADARAKAKRRRPAKLARDFYARALSEAEQREFEAASEIEGIDGEIALLRLRLRETLSKHPEDMPLMLRGIELLVKAVSARYRLSKEDETNLSESIANVIRQVGGVFVSVASDD
jgi:hypothetical protein